MFADDTCIFLEFEDCVDSIYELNKDLLSISKWASKWQITFSAKKTKLLSITNKQVCNNLPNVYSDNAVIDEVDHHCNLGLTFTKNLRWNQHIGVIVQKAEWRLDTMIPLQFKVDRLSLETMYKSFILPGKGFRL